MRKGFRWWIQFASISCRRSVSTTIISAPLPEYYRVRLDLAPSFCGSKLIANSSARFVPSTPYRYCSSSSSSSSSSCSPPSLTCVSILREMAARKRGTYMPSVPRHIKIKRTRQESGLELKRSPMISLLVVSNGCDNTPKSIVIRTDNRHYLVGCGEGTQRILMELATKFLKIDQIMITRESWTQVGGIVGLSLSLESSGADEVNLHAPFPVKKLLECSRSFEGFRALRILEQDYAKSNGIYEDETILLKQTAYPFAAENGKRCFYIFDTKPLPPKLNAEKCTLHGVPPNHLRRQLKDGIAITLENGKVVIPEDVLLPGYPDIRILLLDVHNELGMLEKCMLMVDDQIRNKTPDYVVHFADACTQSSEVYLSWMKDKFSGCRHISLNEQHRNVESAGIYKMQVRLNAISDEFFPLFPIQVAEYIRRENMVAAAEASSINVDNETRCKIEDKENMGTGENIALLPGIENKISGLSGMNLNARKQLLSMSDTFRMQTPLDQQITAKDDAVDAMVGPTESQPHDVSNPQSTENCGVEAVVNEDDIEFRPTDSKRSKHCSAGNGSCDERNPSRAKTTAKVNDIQRNDNSNVGDTDIDDGDTIECLVLPRRGSDEVTTFIENHEFPHVIFLGTGSACPSKLRNVSSILLRCSETSSILFDCGEGTLVQLNRIYADNLDALLMSINMVFISHMHPDHHQGLYGVLRAREKAFTDLARKNNAERQQKYKKPILITCPSNLVRVMEDTMACLQHTEVDSDLSRNASNTLDAQHSSGDSAGIRRLSGDIYLCRNRIMSLGHGSRPEVISDLLHSCSLSEVLVVPVEHIYDSHAVVLKHRDAWSVAYSGDCRPSNDFVKAGQGVDLLIHEATLEDGMEDDAKLVRHCTISEAITVAKDMKARFTLLWHFSQRYSKIPFVSFEDMRNSNIAITFDNMIVPLNNTTRLQQILLPLRSTFSAEFDVFEQRRMRNIAMKTAATTMISPHQQAARKTCADVVDNTCPHTDLPADQTSKDIQVL